MDTIAGKVTAINAAGDLVTDIRAEAVTELVGRTDVEVRFGDHFTQGIFPRDHLEPANTLIAVVGESGFLEVGIVGVNVHEMLAIPPGQAIQIRWPVAPN